MMNKTGKWLVAIMFQDYAKRYVKKDTYTKVPTDGVGCDKIKTRIHERKISNIRIPGIGRPGFTPAALPFVHRVHHG